ncbi:MAG: hypothetical protein QXQ91_01495 [Nanopusillaceae archaeon]
MGGSDNQSKRRRDAWYRSGLYADVEKLSEWMKYKGHGVITGMPGTLKTTRILFTPLFLKKPVVVSFPLRMIRDEFHRKILEKSEYERIRDVTVVALAHDEVCPPLGERIRSSPETPYVKHLSDHLSASERGEEDCEWKKHIEKYIEHLSVNGPKLILTTHRVGFLLKILSWVLRKDAEFIFDEGEDLLLRIGEPVDLEYLNDLRVHRKVWRSVRSIYKKIHPSLRTGYVHTGIIKGLFRECFFVSATFPPILINHLSYGEEDGDYPVYRMKSSRVPDILVILDKVLPWITESTWRKKIYPQVLSVIEKTHEKGYPVGIVSRNLEQACSLTESLENLGYTVWSDHREDNPRPFYYADVVIITTMGRGYRGVNLYTRKTFNRWDFPVVIGFYQGKAIDRAHVHPFFYGLLSDNPFNKEEDEIGELIVQMLHAKNVQSLFRFVRDKQKEHLLILLDQRWRDALKMYTHHYYSKSKRMNVENPEDLFHRVLPLIETL